MNLSLVKITQLGVNPSGVNGFKLKQNVEYTLRHKDRLELLLDKYVHEVIFDPAPESFTQIIEDDVVKCKRKNEDDLDNCRNKQPKLQLFQQKIGWEEIDNKNLYIFTSKGIVSKEKVRCMINFKLYFSSPYSQY